MKSSDLDSWENAHIDFSTSIMDVKKFRRRLKRMKVHRFVRGRVAELFCGRGNGLTALESFGYTDLYGLDLSYRLLSEYKGIAHTIQCDCSKIPHPDEVFDFIVVQGGLHHLENLFEDLPMVLEEIHRILKQGGRFIFIEPWLTPVLSFILTFSFIPFFRKSWSRIDAFARMVTFEKKTYQAWLENPDFILRETLKKFSPQHLKIGLGFINFIGIKKIEENGIA